ncbi:hypothetical protein ACRRRU_19775 [Dickeya fangzhongdai]|uniref:hypothetical protein n=1 Tax=Dickeya fangzhongdai TaxID=1778540 RepID=UPI003D7D25A2
MIINKKNIETNLSMKIGKDNHNHLLKMRIDKLTLVTSAISRKARTNIYRKLSILFVIRSKIYTIERKKLSFEHPYNKSLKITFKKESSPMLVHISFDPKYKNVGDLRLDFRPQHCSPKEMSRLVIWLNRKLGDEFKESLTRAWLTQVDVALDIYKCKLHDYIWGFSRASKGEYYKTENGLPGFKMGSSRSRLHVLCYEKIDATNSRHLVNSEKGNFIDICLKKHSHFLRMEIRFRPNTRPKVTLEEKSIRDHLLKIENIFSKIQVYSTDLIPKLLENKPIKINKNEQSIFEIKKKILKSTGNSILPRKYKRMIQKYKVELLNINSIWEKWHLCVSCLGSVL